MSTLLNVSVLPARVTTPQKYRFHEYKGPYSRKVREARPHGCHRFSNKSGSSSIQSRKSPQPRISVQVRSTRERVRFLSDPAIAWPPLFQISARAMEASFFILTESLHASPVTDMPLAPTTPRSHLRWISRRLDFRDAGLSLFVDLSTFIFCQVSSLPTRRCRV